MENNKAYLKKMPALLLGAFAYGLVSVLLFSLMPPFDPSRKLNAYELIYYIYPLLTFTTLGFITGKWSASIVSMFLMTLFHVAGVWIGRTGVPYLNLISGFLIDELPGVLFLWMISRNTKTIFLNYVLLIFATALFSTALNMPLRGIEITSRMPLGYLLLNLLFRTIGMGLYLVFFMELINLNTQKTAGWKPRLLNLGNEYPKTGSVCLFILLNLALPVVVIGTSLTLQNLIEYRSLSERYGYLNDKIIISGYQVAHLWLSVVVMVAGTILYAWFYRKFMLEHFIHYAQESKFVYWLNFIPVIGIFSFVIPLSEKAGLHNWTGKQQSVQTFAGSSTLAITIIMTALLLLNFLISVERSGAAALISMLIAGLLLVWYINHISGYYFFFYLSLLILIAGLIALLLVEPGSVAKEVPEMFLWLHANLISLIYLMPVYHFSAWEYIPASDPEETVTDENNLLGDLVSRT